MEDSKRRLVLGLTGLAILMTLWELGGLLGWINPFVGSRPSLVATTLVKFIASGEVPRHFWASAQRFGVGYLLAVVLGVPLGLVVGGVRRLRQLAEPYLWFLYISPLIAYYPLFIVWFGLGTPTVIVICFILSFFPIVVNSSEGIRTVDVSLVRAARSFGATNFDILYKVSLPYALPMILTGMRLALGRALVGVIVGEFFGAQSGLGYAISYHGAYLETTQVFVYLVVIGVTGAFITQIMQAYERWVLRWNYPG